MITPAIVVVGYNRPESIKRLLSSICNAVIPHQNVTLIISIDLSEKSEEIKDIADRCHWPYGKKKIRIFSERQGLRNHIISCGNLSEEYGAVIILEDDLVVAKGFYQYVFEVMNYYADADWMAGVALYRHHWTEFAHCEFEPEHNDSDVYLAQYGVTWGQAWSWNQWKKFKIWYLQHVGKLEYKDDIIPRRVTNWGDNSWGKYFAHYLVDQNQYYVVPFESMSTNYSDIGEHRNNASVTYQVPLSNKISNFNMTNYQNCIVYDSFFERKYLNKYLPEGLSEEGVAIDIYGLKALGKSRYILSTSCLGYKVIKSYGLIFRPHEMNIIHDIPGDDIYLYDTKQKEKVPKNRYIMKYKKISYYIKGPYVIDELFHAIVTLILMIYNKLK